MAHIAFIPYGKRTEVELLFRDMESQKHKLRLTSKKDTKEIWIESQLRVLPMGIYEYICPKEDVDTVLNTLITESNNRYNINKLILKFFRGFGRYKPIPKDYKKTNHYLWLKQNVNVTVLGIKDDSTIIDGNYQHEAI